MKHDVYLKYEMGPDVYFKYEMGEVLKDIVSGFEGVVMARSEYSTGCRHYGLCPQKLNEKGAIPGWEWLDESRLIRTKKKRVVLNPSIEDPSGPAPNPPEM
jgi:hypothetical protein